ncbi:MAG: pantothenate synthetase [Glaciecola sp.]
MIFSSIDNAYMKNKTYQTEPPELTSLNEANVLIQELWQQLREYEDKLATSSRNSSLSPSSDSPAARAERKKLKRLVVEIRLALSQTTRGI